MDRWLKIVLLLAVLKACSSARSLCSYGMVTMSCMNLGLTHPPPGYYPTRNNIALSNNNIAELYRESFTGFPNNYVLYINNNKLTELDLDVLLPMTPLNHFDASVNRIRKIVPASAGRRLENLFSIKLIDNNITSLEPNTFEFAPNLSTLDLSFNSLAYISRPILQHRKITLLLATQLCAAWTEECDDPCFCPAAKTVDCDNRGLSQPPPGHWPEITTLSLRENSISVLRKRSLTGFPNIVRLDMNRNRLIELDLETFAALPYLSHLALEENAIATISPAPPGVTIGSLSSLYINENRISSLDPDIFAAATNLKFLHLFENPLSAKEGKPFLNHPTIRSLGMANYLLTLHSLGPGIFGIFNGLPKLEIIELYNLNIKNISGAFVKNPDLYYIGLNRNLISEVTAGTFAPTNKLVVLDLSITPLERLDVSAVADAVPSGGFIHIDDTPLACSCGYQSLYWWAKGKGVYLGARCTGKEPCSFVRSPTSP